MLGRGEVSVPADLVFRPPEPAKVVDMRIKWQDCRRPYELLMKWPEMVVLKTYQVHMKRDYNVKIHTREYAVGEFLYMYVLDSAKTKKRSKKLNPPWKGPGIVVHTSTRSDLKTQSSWPTMTDWKNATTKNTCLAKSEPKSSEKWENIWICRRLLYVSKPWWWKSYDTIRFLW